MNISEKWKKLDKNEKSIIIIVLSIFIIIIITLVIFIIVYFTRPKGTGSGNGTGTGSGNGTGTGSGNGTTLYVGDGSGQCQKVNSNNGIPWTLDMTANQNSNAKAYINGVWGSTSDSCTNLGDANTTIVELVGPGTSQSYDPSNAATYPPIFPGQQLRMNSIGSAGSWEPPSNPTVPSTATKLTVTVASDGSYTYSWN